MPSPVNALSVSTGGRQWADALRSIESAPTNWCFARAAALASMSALVMTMMSASSTIPFLIACKSSPALGSWSSTNASTMPATVVSDWPTPTVSTRMTSKPAASQTSIASRVFSATPPSEPRDGEGRMNEFGSWQSRSIRVLSPRIDPPEIVLDGSTARTATRCPWAITCSPSASMNVDFPEPGAPLIPSRSEPPVRGRIASTTASARAW